MYPSVGGGQRTPFPANRKGAWAMGHGPLERRGLWLCALGRCGAVTRHNVRLITTHSSQEGLRLRAFCEDDGRGVGRKF
eukprot:5050613-Prymnesium_polylepis.1